ncbi:MAG: trypsin-like peptidase domain-containing protein [Clostridiales bacterium]
MDHKDDNGVGEELTNNNTKGTNKENVDVSELESDETEVRKLQSNKNNDDDDISIENQDKDNENDEFNNDNVDSEEDLKGSFIDIYENDSKNSEDEFLLQAASYYSENYKNNKPKYFYTRNQLLLYSFISSVVGGLIVATISFALYSKEEGDFFTVDDYSKDSKTKIEIEKTDSPVSYIAEKVSPSIVGIEVTFESSGLFFSDQETSSQGSGIIIRSDGYIITNYHVITSTNNKMEPNIRITLPNNTNKEYEAKIVGKDSKTDIAVLKIAAKGLTEAELGDDSKLKVGDMAVAIGNPGGLEYMGSVTVGVISGLNRTIPISDNTTLKLIQTDAAINPGNSGGALMNSEGEIIGMNTAKISGVEVEGLGFAIPINEVKKITENLIKYKYVKDRPVVGVIINSKYTEEYANKNGYPVGLMVDDVVPKSGADKAGVKVGDLITKFDGQEVKTFAEFDEIKNNHKPGDIVEIELYRDEENINLDIKLIEEKDID